MHTAPARLVRIGEFQRPSPACLRVLRRVNPRLEMVCLTPGIWWIGLVDRTSAAVLEGQKRRKQLLAHHASGRPIRRLSLWKAELMAQGFRMLVLVKGPQPTPTQCQLAVAPCLRVTRRQVAQRLHQLEQMSSGVPQRAESAAELRDYAEHAGRDAYRHAYHTPIHSLPGRPS